MGFKTGLLVGFGVGYVLGTRAGRERYEELRRAWGQLAGNPQVQAAVSTGKDIVGSGASKGLHAIQGGVERATGAVKERLGGDGEGQGHPST